MTLIRDVVDGALAEVYGEAQTVDTTTFLAAPLTATGLSIEVADATGFSRGIVQIEDELLLITEVDRTKGILTLPYTTARGIRGTEALSHQVGALVTMAPSVPRSRAVRAVAEAITSSPGLWRVAGTSFPMVASQVGYSLPGDVETVLNVAWIPSGPTLDWLPMRRWSHDKFNGMLVVGESVEPGREIRVEYTATPLAPEQDEDFSASGLPDTCIDVIRFGAAWRLVSFIEPFNLLARSAEAEAMDRQKTPQARIRVGQYLYGMYQQRLAEEVASLNTRFPVRVHWTGRW